MGSIDVQSTNAENGSAAASADARQKPVAADAVTQTSNEPDATPPEKPKELGPTKKRISSMLPLDVGTRVMCRWRDGKYHPVKVIERRKLQATGFSDYEYYVHYTECKLLFCSEVCISM